MKFVFIMLFTLLLQPCSSFAQDTIVPSITKIPLKFITQTNTKIDKYTNRITSKTEKTLTKLTKWENKIHILLSKASPETANQLFGEGKQTFASMLQKVQEGKSLAEKGKARYNEYNDKLVTNIKYIATQKEQLSKKIVQPLKKAEEMANRLEEKEGEREAAEKLIQERKKELLTQAYKVLGKNRYITHLTQKNN